MRFPPSISGVSCCWNYSGLVWAAMLLIEGAVSLQTSGSSALQSFFPFRDVPCALLYNQSHVVAPSAVAGHPTAYHPFCCSLHFE